MSEDKVAMRVGSVCNRYIENVQAELATFCSSWKLDLSQNEVHEAVCGMLARQVTQAVYFARSPALWNPHMGPTIFRSMADNFISLAWLCKDPVDRSQKYILYGLGLEKLMIEHRKAELITAGIDPETDIGVQASERWVNEQRYTFLLKVNVGSWSGLSTREMAQESGHLHFYRHVYEPFSATTHNTWQHVSRYNLMTCENPLHGFHKVPIIRMENPDINFLELAAKYADKALRLCANHFKTASTESAYEKLVNDAKQAFRSDDDGAIPPVTSGPS